MLCYGEVVIRSTSGHQVFLTRLLLVSQMQVINGRVFYTVRYFDDAKQWLCVGEVLHCFKLKYMEHVEGDNAKRV